jgi:2-polyprenyl-6-hydroxyphenyl methylase/3-demethylubiquinone-9 3-methyltransferase
MSSNVDPAEIAKFDALADRWWDATGEFRPLHDINPTRAEYVESKCGGLFGKALVDVGCGGGILSEALAARGAKVTGIDMGEAPLTVARLHARAAGIGVDYQRTTAEALAVSMPEAFDVVTCLEMIEHVPDPGSVINACAAMLKPGGHLVLSTINRHPKAYLLAVLGAEYVLGLLPRGTHNYERFITPAELSGMVRTAELLTDDIVGMRYNPFTHDCALTHDVDVNYLLHAEKPRLP